MNHNGQSHIARRWSLARLALAQLAKTQSWKETKLAIQHEQKKNFIVRDIVKNNLMLGRVTVAICDEQKGIVVIRRNQGGKSECFSFEPDGFYIDGRQITLNPQEPENEKRSHWWARVRDIILLHQPDMRNKWKATEPSNTRSVQFSGSGSLRPLAPPRSPAQPQPR